jgi:hypothetical protein
VGWAAAENRIRRWADAADEPNQKYRDAHAWYDSAKKENFTAYKLLIADVINDRFRSIRFFTEFVLPGFL